MWVASWPAASAPVGSVVLHPHVILFLAITVFCALLFVLRTGISWRDLPPDFGYWHSVYLRFKKGSDRGVWWKVLIALQQYKKLTMNVVLTDSTTVKVHRHGGGLKGGSRAKALTAPV